MNQAELIAQVSELTGLSKKDTEHVLKTVGDIVADELHAGGEVTLPGIGKLATKQRAARTGRNPQTGEAIEIPAKVVVDFSPAKSLRDAAA